MATKNGNGKGSSKDKRGGARIARQEARRIEKDEPLTAEAYREAAENLDAQAAQEEQNGE